MRTIMVEKTLCQFHELPDDAKAYARYTYWDNNKSDQQIIASCIFNRYEFDDKGRII